MNRFHAVRRAPLLTLLATIFASPFAHAQGGTRQWTTARYEDFERGTPSNIAVRNDGLLQPAPALRLLASTPATFLWSLAAEGSDFYAGSGAASGGSQVFRIDAKGGVTTAANLKELAVQALLPAGDGTVLAAGSPDGKVYRIGPAGTPQVVFDSTATAEKPRYIWSMARVSNGDLLVATGAPAAIYRVSLKDPSAKPQIFFRSGDQHIRCLLAAPDGTVYAGSDGAGIIYRIDPSGKPFALYAAPRHEITSLALDPNGNLYAAAVGDRKAPSLPPLPASGQTAVSITVLQPGSTISANSNSVVPEGSDIYRVAADGTPMRLVALSSDVIYSLAFRNGALFAGAGNRGRVYKLDLADPGAYTDVAHTEASQVTAMVQTADGIALATANSGKLLKLSDTVATDATYTSDVFDGGTATAWGRAELLGRNANGGSAAIDFFVRSGNVENPRDRLANLWSDWKPVAPEQTPLPAPAARYLQWKAVLHPGSQLRSVTVNYLPHNLPPVVEDVVVQPGARVPAAATPPPATTIPVGFRSPTAAAPSTPVADAVPPPLIAQRDRNFVTARWIARDPNNDRLTYTLEFRGVHETEWRRVRENIADTVYSFDAGLMPDGEYELRVTASDAPSHTPGDALQDTHISAPFVIDTTPPVPGTLTAAARNNQVHATFEATDATSPIARAEYSLDAAPWQYLEPVGRLSDSRTEHYDFTVALPPGVAASAEHTVAVRIYDRHENAVSVKTVTRP